MIKDSKHKHLNYLRADVQDNVFSNFKRLRALKNTKSDLLAFFKKKLRIRNKSNVFIKNIFHRLSSRENKRSRVLNFNSKNSKNAFLRTKRKSSYGQTLLEKQKIKGHLIANSKHVILKEFDKNRSNLVFGLNTQPYQIVNSLGLFTSKHSLENLSKYDFGVSHDELFVDCDVSGVIDNVNFCKLRYALRQDGFKRGTNRLIYNRILPFNLVYDVRVGKVKKIGHSYGHSNRSCQQPFPFFFNVKKFNQHFFLKKK